LSRIVSIRCRFTFSASYFICKEVGTHFILNFFFLTNNDNDFTNAVADLPLPNPIV